jgi:hypothetical protein
LHSVCPVFHVFHYVLQALSLSRFSCVSFCLSCFSDSVFSAWGLKLIVNEALSYLAGLVRLVRQLLQGAQGGQVWIEILRKQPPYFFLVNFFLVSYSRGARGARYELRSFGSSRLIFFKSIFF